MRLEQQADLLIDPGIRLQLDKPKVLPAGGGDPRGLRHHVAAVLILLAGMLLAHGWALHDGLFGDDHLHLLRYRSPDVSWQALLDGSNIRFDDLLEAWWQDKPTEWRYVRPLPILLGKAVYHLSGGNVKALHAVSLILHLASAVMVYALVVLTTGRKFWGVVAGLLFVVYSHSVYAVAWLAAQNAVLQTCLTLAALLAYVRASRLNLDAGRPRGFDDPPKPLRTRLFLLCLLFWGLGLLAREVAIVFPVLAVGADLAFGGWRQLRTRWAAYAVMAAGGAAFLIWRIIVLFHPIPDWYCRHWDGPGYLLWCLAKLLHYVTSAIWLSPMMIGPSGRLDPWREVPGDCLLMIMIVGVMSTGYFLACRRARGWWLWPLWVLVAFLPVVPVMAGPHIGYMAGAGFAVAMVLGPALRDRIQPVSIGKWSRPVAIWFLIATCTYIPIYRAMWHSVNAAERITIAGVVAMPPPPEARELFFINLPFINVYAQLHLAEELGTQFRVHALTHAPDMLRMDRPSRIEQLDRHSFRLSIEGRPYFSGALGQFLIAAMRSGGRMRAGEVFHTDLYDVEIVTADEDGVRELIFRFHEPLTSPRFCFYVSTNQCGAARVRFIEDGRSAASAPGDSAQPAPPAVSQIEEAARDLDAGKAAAADLLFTAAASPDKRVATAAQAVLCRLGRPVAEGLAAPMQEVWACSDTTSADWARARRWWLQHVDDEAVKVLWRRRAEYEPLRRTRETLYSIRQTASRVIRTDLYMTGPPFPSPR